MKCSRGKGAPSPPKDGDVDSDKIQHLIDVASRLLDMGDTGRLRQAMEEHHPADVAEVLERLPDDLRNELFAALDDEMAGDVLIETDEATRAEIVEDLEPQTLTQVLETMPPDEAADIVGDLPEDQTEEVLDHLHPAASERIEDILQYDEDSAGGIMTPVLIRVRDDMTVAEAVKVLQAGNLGDEEFFYIYVVDADDRLVGVVRARSLITSPPNTLVRDALDPDVTAVSVDADQEQVAETFQRYDYLAMPVVDHDGKLLGRITIDDVMDVITEEATEDAYKMAGTDDSELATHSVFKVARIRMSWLLACLGGGIVTGVVLRFFQASVGEKLGLMAFVPVIMSTGGNSAVQTATVIVRGLATGDIDTTQLLKAFFRELRIALVVGVCCGLATGLIARASLGESTLGLVVGLTMFCDITLAASFGAILPLAVKKMGGDPAIACGPLVTTTNDSTSLCLYLVIAKLLIG